MNENHENKDTEQEKKFYIAHGERIIDLETVDGKVITAKIRGLPARHLLKYLDAADEDEKVIELTSNLTESEIDSLKDKDVEMLADMAKELNFERAICKGIRRVQMVDQNTAGQIKVLNELHSVMRKFSTTAPSSSDNQSAGS